MVAHLSTSILSHISCLYSRIELGLERYDPSALFYLNIKTGRGRIMSKKCAVSNCNRMLPTRSKKKYCRKHDYHYKRYGDAEKYVSEPQSFCAVIGCGRISRSNHLCQMHLARKRKYGDVGPPSTTNICPREKFPNEWYSYNNMKIRCTCKSHKQYKDYGGRGVKICERWLGPYGFLYFLEDMGNRPDGCTLDRIDVDGDYCPENCRWASREIQQVNRRNTVKVKYMGEDVPISELARKKGLPLGVLYNRIMKYNWPIYTAITTPVRSRRSKK